MAGLRRLWDRILTRDGDLCSVCGEPIVWPNGETHHTVPGDDRIELRILLHQRCHQGHPDHRVLYEKGAIKRAFTMAGRPDTTSAVLSEEFLAHAHADLYSDGIPDEIKDIRSMFGLTQSEFARRFGVCFQSVDRWERGKSRPRYTTLLQIRAVAEAVRAPRPPG
jgi:DNA-binding transcriptional regulator YiaG